MKTKQFWRESVSFQLKFKSKVKLWSWAQFICWISDSITVCSVSAGMCLTVPFFVFEDDHWAHPQSSQDSLWFWCESFCSLLLLQVVGQVGCVAHTVFISYTLIIIHLKPISPRCGRTCFLFSVADTLCHFLWPLSVYSSSLKSWHDISTSLKWNHNLFISSWRSCCQKTNVSHS